MLTYVVQKIKGNIIHKIIDYQTEIKTQKNGQREIKSFVHNKKLCTIFYYIVKIYAFIAFNFLAKLDFFLAAVFLTITPFVQA